MNDRKNRAFVARRCAVSIGAAALLAGCGGSQRPIVAPGAMPQSRVIVTHANRGGSWMLPEAKSEDLLYVSSHAPGAVKVFSYPEGKLVGTLTGLSDPDGLCVDKAGNVWVTQYGGSAIIEYAHGGAMPIGSLGTGQATACAVDPTSNDLAITTVYCSSYGNVLIYQNEQGTPSCYNALMYVVSFCGYDNAGNFFVIGNLPISGYQVTVTELPRDGEAFALVHTPKSYDEYESQVPGLQWYRNRLVVGDDTGSSGGQHIFQFSVKKDKAKERGQTVLDGLRYISQFWIQAGKLVVADSSGVQIFDYPAGGKAVKQVGVLEPYGVTMSRAPR